jgi:hypothetical protein
MPNLGLPDQILLSGPFPRRANSTSSGIYLRRPRYRGTCRFLPEQKYRVGNDSLTRIISMEVQRPNRMRSGGAVTQLR